MDSEYLFSLFPSGYPPTSEDDSTIRVNAFWGVPHKEYGSHTLVPPSPSDILSEFSSPTTATSSAFSSPEDVNGISDQCIDVHALDGFIPHDPNNVEHFPYELYVNPMDTYLNPPSNDTESTNREHSQEQSQALGLLFDVYSDADGNHVDTVQSPLTAIDPFDDTQRHNEDPTEAEGNETEDEYTPSSSAKPQPPRLSQSPKNKLKRRRASRPQKAQVLMSSKGPHLACDLCPYVQTQKKPRTADLRRHKEVVHKVYEPDRAHVEREFRCVGPFVDDPSGQAYIKKYPRTNRYYEWHGKRTVGGCGQWFTRPDTRLRHLRLMKGKCLPMQTR